MLSFSGPWCSNICVSIKAGQSREMTILIVLEKMYIETFLSIEESF